MPSTTINGRQFDVANPEDPYWQWVRDGCYDHEWKTYDKYLKPEQTFVDLGAWIGSHSMYASRAVRQTLAVEPDPVAYEILKANLEFIEPLPDHRQYAIASEHGLIRLGSAWLGASTTRKNLAAGNHIGAADKTFEIPQVPLRTLLKEWEGPYFIKIDVEGMEEDIFKDWQLFREHKPTVFVEFHPWWWENESETRKNFALLADGYKVVDEVKPLLYLLADA